jgi:hypothetical protein
MSTDQKPEETTYEPPALRVLGDVHVLTEGPIGTNNPDATYFHSSL